MPSKSTRSSEKRAERRRTTRVASRVARSEGRGRTASEPGRERSEDRAQSIASAREAGLRYVSDKTPGIRREMGPLGFKYIATTGHVIRTKSEITRINKLAIPPAWTNVWICPDPRGHIQATGRDAKGRKQYRYHHDWRQYRDEDKYGRMIGFAGVLPKIRQRTNADLAAPGLTRNKVLAAVVQLLEKSLIRVGNDEYAKKNRSFGLTTLRNRHVEVRGAKVTFEFKGKSGVQHSVDVEDRRLAKIIKECQELPGQELFVYIDESGEHRDVGSADVNGYLQEITGAEFTAKDFRTWAGTVLACTALQEIKGFDTQARAKKNVVRAVEAVAGMLGNTKAVCRKSYIHPAVIDSYMDGSLLPAFSRNGSTRKRGLRADEAAVLAFLQQRLARESRRRRAA
jgi:DNA topoisomerase I